MMTDHEFRSGFVAVAGRPNVGKSTLVNRITGQELCIVTKKAQTTRNRITAIHTLDEAQLILVDTPGIHEPWSPLNRAMVDAAVKTVEEADAVLLMTTPEEEGGVVHEADERILGLLSELKLPTVLAVNKIDTVAPPMLLPLIEAYSKAYEFSEIIPVSALHGDGVDDLVKALIKLLPMGPPLFPEDDLSDLPARFFVAELIREQVTRLTGEEIPYKTAVLVEAFKERDNGIFIQADIHAERTSQKKILIGKGGQMIKKIGIAARRKIEEFLDSPVHLKLFVKVTPNWTKDLRRLKEFGYSLREKS